MSYSWNTPALSISQLRKKLCDVTSFLPVLFGVSRVLACSTQVNDNNYKDIKMVRRACCSS